MFNKLWRKLKIKKQTKYSQANDQEPKFGNGKQLLATFHSIIEQHSEFHKSNFYTSYIKTLLSPMAEFFDCKVKQINSLMDKENILSYQKQQVNLILNIINEDGVFYAIISLWSGYFDFRVKQLIQSKQHHQVQLSSQILTLFHQQYFLLCLFVYRISLFLYDKIIASIPEFDYEHLFHFIRNQLTSCHKFASVHNHIIKNVICKVQPLDDGSIHENIQDLEKLCKVSKIPIPFEECLSLAKDFYRNHEVKQKLKIAMVLIDRIRQYIGQYRLQNQFEGQYLIAADDIFSVLAYVLWRINRNTYGACAYIEGILSCQYPQIMEDVVVLQLQKQGHNCRHSFETIKSVSLLGYIPQQLRYLL